MLATAVGTVVASGLGAIAASTMPKTLGSTMSGTGTSLSPSCPSNARTSRQ